MALLSLSRKVFRLVKSMVIFAEAAFDLTILVPKSKFTEASSIKYGRDSPVEVDNISDLSQYLHLSLPAGGADCIRDIKQTIAESAEGFWIGAHSFVRILLKEDVAVKEGEVPKIVIDGKPSEVLDDTMDLAHVFEGDAYRNQEIQRILKVVESKHTHHIVWVTVLSNLSSFIISTIYRC